MSELVIFESESQTGFLAVLGRDGEVDFDGPLGYRPSGQRVRELRHEVVLVVSLVLKSREKHETRGPQRHKSVDDVDSLALHNY